MDVRDAVDEVGGYTHRNPPTEEEMARLRRLAHDAEDPWARVVLTSSLSDLETLREIESMLTAAQD